MRPKVYVVEGKNDYAKLKQLYPDMFILTTNGSEILESTLDALIKLDETHDIILFLDPDYPGKRIRDHLSSKLKHVYHAFIEKDKAHSKNYKKLGVEHASQEDIEDALKKIYQPNDVLKTDIDPFFLYDVKLVGHKDSKSLRDKLSKELHIGHVNGKTLYQRLKAFGISKKDVCEVISCNTKPKKDTDKTF